MGKSRDIADSASIINYLDNLSSDVQNQLSTAAITSGTIDGVTIGGTTPGTGSFTTLDATGDVEVTGKLSSIGNFAVGTTPSNNYQALFYSNENESQVLIEQDSSSSSGNPLRINNNGLGTTVLINSYNDVGVMSIEGANTDSPGISGSFNSLTTAAAMYVYSSSNSTSSRSIIDFQQTSAFATNATVLKLTQASTADALFIDMNGSGNALYTDGGNVVVNNGNVGINTTPSAPFHVTVAGDAYGLFTRTGATNWFYGIDDSDSDCFVIGAGSTVPNGTNTIRLDQSGGVSIPNGSLDIGTYSTTASGTLFLNGTTANKRAQLLCSNGNLHIDSDVSTGIYLNWFYGNHTVWGIGSQAPVARLDADYFQHNSDVRTPIFYDSDNTGYYLDPSVNSNLNVVIATNYYTDGWFRNNVSGLGLYNQATAQHFYSDDDDYWNIAGGTSANGLRFRDEYAGTIRGYVYADNSNNIGFLNNVAGWRARVVGGDYFLVEGSSARAPIFYDSGDTNYYINPNGVSVLNQATYGGLIIGKSSANTDVNTANDGGSISIRGSTTTVAAMSFHRTGAYAINMGLGVDGIFRIGGWSASANAFQLDGSGNTYALTSHRAPIFYDSNNTTFYTDPASTSRLNITTVSNYVDIVFSLTGASLNPASGNIQYKTVSANTTFSDALTTGESMVLQLTNAGNYTITWPTITWTTSNGNTAPTLTTNDTLVFWKIGSTLYGAYVGSGA
jgi:hypothetical protein